MTSKLNPIAREPILTTVVAALIAWAAARYGFKVSPDQAAALAGAVLVVAGPYARQLVTPVAKDTDPVTTPVLDQVVKEVLARNAPPPAGVFDQATVTDPFSKGRPPPDPAKPPVP